MATITRRLEGAQRLASDRTGRATAATSIVRSAATAATPTGPIAPVEPTSLKRGMVADAR